MDQVGALVLAAGEGHRFGGPKLMASFRGRPLLSHVLTVVKAAMSSELIAEAWAVVPKEDEQLRTLVGQAGVIPVPNDCPLFGISHSIRLGLGALTEQGGERLGAAIVLLGDQPLVRLDTLHLLIQSWRHGQGRTLRPRYADSPEVPGHPVLLDRSLWNLAELVTGDRGLDPFLRDDPQLVFLDVPGSNPDIDSAADLRTIEGQNS
jgi:CTP:molybdopterin cytidylyltransferase MocA